MLPLFILGALGVGAFLLWQKAQNEGVTVSQEVSSLVPPIEDAPVNASDPSDPVAIALPLIEGFESFSAHAYEDPQGSGKYSIGYGHSIRAGEPYNAGSTIGQSEAQDLLRVDVGAAWTCVYCNVTAACSSQQYAALISFVYNEGCAAFQSSTLLSKLNQGDFDGAAQEFAVWNKAHINGVLTEVSALTERRASEAQLFQSGVSA